MDHHTLRNERYEILHKLGSGGMATVYKARDRHTGRVVAIKIMDERLAHRTEVLKRFELEAAAMDKLKHPHIVPLHDVNIEGDERFIVMDFIDGESLLDRMERKALGPAEALEVLIPVLDALVLAHDKGIVHRDIKPHNILISKANQVFVSDFGIARVIDETDMSLTRTGVVMGTWAFMAPEQRADAKGVDALADIYSVGATLFAAVTGETPKDLFAAELDPTIYKGVPKAIEAIIRRACAYWTADRYPNAAAMRRDVFDTLQKFNDGSAFHERESVQFRAESDSPKMGDGPRVMTAPPLGPEVSTAPPAPVIRPQRQASAGGGVRGEDNAGNPQLLMVGALVAVALIGILSWTLIRTLDTIDPDASSEVATLPLPNPIAEDVNKADQVKLPEAPTLHHTPVSTVALRESLELMAEITGSGAYDQVQAWYRPIGQIEWSRTGMRRVGNEYRGSIEVTPLFTEGLEYWIEAKPYHKGLKPLTHGSSGRPVKVLIAR